MRAQYLDGSRLMRVLHSASRPDKLQTGADDCGGDDVVDKESPAVWHKDAVPVEAPVLEEIIEVSMRGGEPEGWEDDDHEEKIPERLRHYCIILS